MNITIPKGIKIGHSNDDYTGVTVVLCEKGCVCGADVRGGAPGTRETDLLKSEKAAQEVHAVVLTGGSAYGLESTCGVMEYLKEKGVGVKVGGKRVPIVCGAVIFDLIYDDYHWPDKAAGRKACENASANDVPFGQVGVGKGATVGKFRGMKHASKSGVGAATVKVAGITVTAIVAVNALGDVIDTGTGKIVAGCKGKNGAFVGAEQKILDGEYFKLITATTTIGCAVSAATSITSFSKPCRRGAGCLRCPRPTPPACVPLWFPHGARKSWCTAGTWLCFVTPSCCTRGAVPR